MAGERGDRRDVAGFEERVVDAVDRSRSLSDLSRWLESQHCVESVRLRDYLIKTNPPRREFSIVVRDAAGSADEKTLSIALLPRGGFAFHEIR